MCEQKKCRYCHQIKTINDFSKNAKLKDGYANKCKTCAKEYDRNYYLTNSDRIKDNSSNYYYSNIDLVKNNEKEYRKKNKERYREYQRDYKSNRRKKDIQFKLEENLRTRLSSAIRSKSKKASAVRDLGCSLDYFKEYISNQFTDGMSWDNYGEWHLDHKIPLSWFDLTDREELRYACFYLNYQPLWATDNISKNNRYMS